MKIAVTYDKGNIFQHFGRTEAFKVYQAEDGKVVSSEILSSNGTGHSALAGLLAGAGAAVVGYHLFAHIQVRVEAWQDPIGTYSGSGGHSLRTSGASREEE